LLARIPNCSLSSPSAEKLTQAKIKAADELNDVVKAYLKRQR